MTNLPGGVAKRKRVRRRGRPLRDDAWIIDVVAALRIAWGLSERAAIDLALALVEGRTVTPSKLPRGAGKYGGVLVGYELGASFAGRASTLRQKMKMTTPRDPIVQALVALLPQRNKSGPRKKT